MTPTYTRPGTPRTASATGTTVKVFGGLAAFAGVEHGLGEISQGSVTPPAMVFESWPHVAAFDPLNGEPAMSLIPNLLVSGTLTVLTALALGAVAVSHPGRPHTGRLLLVLSLVLLLVGGGFGPPLLGALTALLATRIGAPARRPGTATRLGAHWWPWPLLVAAASFLGLVPGTALLYAASAQDLSTLVGALALTAFTATGLAMWTARARDRVSAAEPPTPLDSGHSGVPRRPGRDNTQRPLPVPGQRPRTASASRDTRGPRPFFRVWAACWFIIVATLFLAVTALTLALWATDPDYTETTPITDLGFFALGTIIATGFLGQLRAHPSVTALHQGVLATVALAAAGLLGGRIEPLVGALVILAAFVVLGALHPAPRTLLHLDRPPGRPAKPVLMALAAIAAVPALWQATRLLDAAAAAGPSCFAGQCARGDRLAELAAALVTVATLAQLAAVQPSAARLPLWTAGATAILIGATSLALPGATGSLGIAGGAFAAGWGGLFIAAGAHPPRHHRRPAATPRVLTATLGRKEVR